MTSAREKRNRRNSEVANRAERPNHMYSYCRVVGCVNPARAGTNDGLDEKFCRSHADYYQRHGNHYKGSYSAKILNPYRRAALAWLSSNTNTLWVETAVKQINSLYRNAGAHVEAFRLRGLPPMERTKAHWARLRKAEINPLYVIAAWLAVEMVIRDDKQPVSTNEFKRVQAAKIVHRMASGSHKRWGQDNTQTTELHVYPRSRGRVLRYIGKDLEYATELLVDHHLDDVHGFKRERDRTDKFDDRPHPRLRKSRKTN